jgi:pyruvate formate lyase activating enzyme
MSCVAIQKMTLIDFPRHVAATVFTRGCPFRCFYCHNPELVLPEQYAPEISYETVIAFLHKRVGMLDGICITGGEPTMWSELESFIKTVRGMGYAIKLDTNGYFPDIVSSLLAQKLIDYVAMDIKAPLNRYSEIIGVSIDTSRIARSIELLQAAYVSGILADYEFRTTLVKPLLSVDDAAGIRDLVSGVPHYYLQNFVESKHVGSVNGFEPFTALEAKQFSTIMQERVADVVLRGSFLN